jgi:hypothetical protein
MLLPANDQGISRAIAATFFTIPFSTLFSALGDRIVDALIRQAGWPIFAMRPHVSPTV